MTEDPGDLGDRGREIVRQVNAHTDQVFGVPDRVTALERRLVEVEIILGSLADALSVERQDREGADTALHERIDELTRMLDETRTQVSGLVDGAAIMAARLDAHGTELDDHEQRIAALEGAPGEPQWTLVANVPCTAAKSDGWSEPYEGGGKGGSASQGPRVAEHLDVDVVDDASVLRFWTKPYEGKDRTLWNGYEIKNGDWASSGIMLTGHLVGPGWAWETEARAFGPTKLTRMAMLTWPQKGDPWPEFGEVDYGEAGGDAEYAGRQAFKISNHYEDEAGEHKHDEQKIPCDLTEWHTWRVEWTDGLLVFYVDGVHVWHTTEHVPPGPHRLAFQTALEGGPKAKDGTEVGGFEVRAVRLYQRA